jgi:hypothetical protein
VGQGTEDVASAKSMEGEILSKELSSGISYNAIKCGSAIVVQFIFLPIFFGTSSIWMMVRKKASVGFGYFFCLVKEDRCDDDVALAPLQTFVAAFRA